MQIKLIIFFVVVSLAGITGTILKTLEASEKNGTIKEQEKTISLLKSNVDSLNKALENSKENANIVNLTFDKTKLKGSGNIIIDTKQLQALSCDTANIIRWYEGLKPRERRKYR
jgi:hypothetical protein